MPDRLPALRPDGRRYPQTVLSGTYEISSQPTTIDHGHYREIGRNFVFDGEGWGHQVGMSQFGALAFWLNQAAFMATSSPITTAVSGRSRRVHGCRRR